MDANPTPQQAIQALRQERQWLGEAFGSAHTRVDEAARMTLYTEYNKLLLGAEQVINNSTGNVQFHALGSVPAIIGNYGPNLRDVLTAKNPGDLASAVEATKNSMRFLTSDPDIADYSNHSVHEINTALGTMSPPAQSLAQQQSEAAASPCKKFVAGDGSSVTICPPPSGVSRTHSR